MVCLFCWWCGLVGWLAFLDEQDMVEGRTLLNDVVIVSGWWLRIYNFNIFMFSSVLLLAFLSIVYTIRVCSQKDRHHIG